jgi:hypothetical protein
MRTVTADIAIWSETDVSSHVRHFGLALRLFQIVPYGEVEHACYEAARNLTDKLVVLGNRVVVDHAAETDLVLILIDSVKALDIEFVGLEVRIFLDDDVKSAHSLIEEILLSLSLFSRTILIDRLALCDDVLEGVVLVLVIASDLVSDGGKGIPAAVLLNTDLAECVLAALFACHEVSLDRDEP